MFNNIEQALEQAKTANSGIQEDTPDTLVTDAIIDDFRDKIAKDMWADYQRELL